MSNPDVKNDAAPKWASNSPRVFLMGRVICALTGRAARHENTKKYFSRQHFPKKILSGSFCYQDFEQLKKTLLPHICGLCGGPQVNLQEAALAKQRGQEVI